MRSAAVRVGARAADLKPHVPARRLDEPGAQADGNAESGARRLPAALALAAVSIGGIVLALLALQKIGLDNIAAALINSSPALVLLGLGVMCSSMFLRAVSWHAILRAALPAGAGALRRRHAGDVHRRADVLDAARPAR